MAKSVTVKIGSDTTDFLNELKKAEKEINKTQKTANNLAKSLKFDYDENRAVQAQRQFQKAIQQTEQSAQKLRDRLKEMQEAGDTDSVDYSRLELELAKTEAKAADLKKKLEEVKNVSIEQLTKKFKDVGDKISGAGQKLSGLSLAAAGAIGGAAALGKQAAATGAEIDDMTQRFGISAETIQRWSYLSLQAGVDSTTFTRALIKARAAMSDLSAGTSNTAVQTLEKLGIAANQFGSDEEMFNGIIAALSKVEDKALQTAYANEIFGDKIATELLPYINAGADDLAKWNAEFDAMPSLTGEEAAALALLDDTFNRLNTTMQYAAAQLGLALAPLIERVVEWIESSLVPAIEDLAAWFEKLSPGMQNTILALAGITAVAAPLLIIIGKVASGIGALLPLLKSLTQMSLNSAIGFGAMVAAVGLVFQIITNWENMNALQRVIALIGVLTVAALGAAVAFGVFHSAWSLGLAVAGIVAGIGVAVAAINSAKDEIEEPQIDDFNSDEYSQMVTNGSAESSNIPTYSGGGNSYTENSSNDQYNVTITINGDGMSAEEIAEEVSKKIATLAQSRG